MKRIFLAALLAALAIPNGAAAQSNPAPAAQVQASPALQQRIDGLVPILKGEGDYASYFSDAFRAQVPQAKFAEIGKQIGAAIGDPVKVEEVTAVTANAAKLRIGYTRGVATAEIAVDPNAPHVVTGLRITGVEPRNDTVDQVTGAIQSLPGSAGFGIYVLGDTGVTPVAQLHGDVAAPLGSSFKLWILAEATRQIHSGQHRWTDIIPLQHTSLMSGTLGKWPVGSPMTLHSLAALMISQSDNNATDTLLAALGPDRVAAMVGTTGVTDPSRMSPFLSTREAFALKDPRHAGMLTAWQGAATPDTRRAVLAAHAAEIAAPIPASVFAGKPRAIDSAEWFASPADEAHTLDWLRRNGGDTALKIMAINPGVASDIAGKFDYVGYKGGSEPGVIALNYLVRRKDGRWFAVTGNWHRSDAPVDDTAFAALMGRALLLAASL